MTKNLSNLPILLGVLLCLPLIFVATNSNGEDDNVASKSISKKDRAKLESLFQKYYPKATFKNRGVNGIHFEYDVKTFENPASSAIGSKQLAKTELGPKKDGIVCGIYFEQGRYKGQTALMADRKGGVSKRVVDRKDYKTELMAPYSANQDAHLWVSLSYPPDASEDFLKEFREIMANFQNDAD